MSAKHARRHQRARMIRAAAKSDHPILCEAAAVDWIQAEGAEAADKPKRFSMLAYTGGPMVVGYYGAPVIIDLAGLQASDTLPILLAHDHSAIVGHADDVKVSATRINLAGAISGVGPAAVEVQATAKNGFPWKASVGVRPEKLEFVGEDIATKVNGKSYRGPLYVARKSSLQEVSFVAVAADSRTSAQVAATAAKQQERIMDPKFQAWIEAMGLVAAELREDQIAKLQSKYDSEIKASAASGKTVEARVPEFDLRGVVLCYERHVATVQATAATYTGKIDATQLSEIRAKAEQKAAELKLSAMNEEWPAVKLEVALVKAQADAEVELIRAERPKGPAIHASGRDMSAPVIEAALCQTLNVPGHEKQYDEKALQSAHTMFRGRIGLQQLFIMAAAANGYNAQAGERIHTGNLRAVLRAAMIEASSTLSLSGILSNVANKELLAGFADEDQTWREIAAIKTVSDFKSMTSYRLLDNMEYEELPPDGTIKSGTVSEESYTRQAKTYAKMFALSRTDIINDDMGAFDDIRTRLGRGAARKFNKVFWAKFINNSSFFTAARGNYISGATTTLLTDFVGLALGVKAFDDLKSTAVPPAKTGTRIGGTPTILLVPPELEAIAMQIFATIAASEAAKVNPYAGKYKPVKAHQLSDSTYTGYSATAWYLLRNPAILAAIVVSFLNGVQAPIVESADADFDQLGVQFRGYHDFGCDTAEWLAGVKSKGAA